MKLADPQLFCQTVTAAPALNRGLAVLAVLGERAPLSLEALVNELQLPKASVFRLLGTLQEIGMVRRAEDKRYEPLWTLQPLEDIRTIYRQKIEKKIAALCRATGRTIEWYEPGETGLKLVHQENPDSELRVQAKPGFVREWGQEFEAVARLGYAFVREVQPISPLRMLVSNGVMGAVPPREVRRLLTEARAKKSACDVLFNCNGVRRCAVAAFDETGKTFFGVLALAEAFHFSPRSRIQTFLKPLTEALKTS